MWEQLEQWDREFFIFLNSLGIERWDGFWIFVTQIEHWIPFYVFMFILFFYAYSKRKALLGIALTLVTVFVVLGLTEGVKNSVGRLRPNNTGDLAEMIRVLQSPFDFSFFSGHAAVSFAVVTFVTLALRHRFSWVYILYIWPVLFVLSRIYVGVHYPGDIMVGALVGTLLGLGHWHFLARKKLRPLSDEASYS